jgi:hypothetical protein
LKVQIRITIYGGTKGGDVAISVEEMILTRMGEIRESLTAIFTSLEASRKDASDWRQMAERRMTTLETKMNTIVDNGQPGRMSKAEKAIVELKLFKAQAVAVGAAIGGLIGSISAAIGWLFPRK